MLCGYTSRERPDFAGDLGIDESGCIARGCCWEESQQEVCVCTVSILLLSGAYMAASKV